MVTGDDGILFDNMLCVHGEVPPRRFAGQLQRFRLAIQPHGRGRERPNPGRRPVGHLQHEQGRHLGQPHPGSGARQRQRSRPRHVRQPRSRRPGDGLEHLQPASGRPSRSPTFRARPTRASSCRTRTPTTTPARSASFRKQKQSTRPFQGARRAESGWPLEIEVTDRVRLPACALDLRRRRQDPDPEWRRTHPCLLSTSQASGTTIGTQSRRRAANASTSRSTASRSPRRPNSRSTSKSVERLSFRTGPYRNEPTIRTSAEKAPDRDSPNPDVPEPNAIYHIDDVDITPDPAG